MPPASATPWAAAASAAAQKQVTSKEATSKEAQTTSPEPSAVNWKTLAGQKRTTQTPTGALQPPRSGEGNAAPSKEAISKAAASKESGASPTQSSETAPTSPKQKKASPAGEGRTPPRRGTAELSDADLSDGSSRGEASKEAHNTEMQLDSESEYPELSAGQRAAQRSERALSAVAEGESTQCSGGTADASAPKGAAPAPPPPLNQLEAEQAVVQARFSATAKAAATSRVAAGIVPPDQYRGLTRTAMLVEEQSPAIATRPTALKPSQTFRIPKISPEQPTPEQQQGQEQSAAAPQARAPRTTPALLLLLVWANHPRPGLCPHTVARPGIYPHMRKILTQAPCAQDYGWIKFSHTSAPEPINLSSLATQVEIELDDEEILYDRGKVRLEHAGKDRAQAIGYYPQEATYYLSGEGDKDEGIIRYVDDRGKQITLIGVICDCTGNELGSASVDPGQPANRTAQRKALQAKMRSRKAGQKSDGIRVRYDLPSAYMSTSQADGGFLEAETAIHDRANAAARVRAMSQAPRYELKQPEDFLMRRKLNKLELWINFNTPADAEHFDFSFLKYPQLAKGVAPLQGYLATSTCETLGLKQCCFAKPGACSAENGSAYCVARRNAMAIAGIGTSPDLHLEAKSAIKRERQEEREMKAETHKQQRRDAERARLCTDYKEGKVRTLPPERASRADCRRVAVPNQGMREGTPPWEEGCEENHLHHDDLRGEMPDRALPIQARTLMAGTGSQGTSGETDAQQRLEGRGDRRIRRDSGSAKRSER